MADRRRYRGGAGHHTPVERARATSRDSGSHGDHGARVSEAREGRERESQGHRRRGELRRGRALSDERFGPLGRLTCAKKARPSTQKPMRSSERWKETLGGGEAYTTRNWLICDGFSMTDLQIVTDRPNPVTIIYFSSWLCTSGYFRPADS